MKRALNLIGLAKRASAVACGARLCEASIKKKKAQLVIIAADASDNTKKEITDACNYYKVKYLIGFDKESMGQIIGMEEISVVGVTDKNFADGIIAKLNNDVQGKER